MNVARRRSVWLVAALLACGVLLAAPSTQHAQAAPPLNYEQAWPRAHRAAIPQNLADGTAYEPVLFIDPTTSLGTAATKDGKSERLLLRRADGSTRELRRVGNALSPSFPTAAVTGNLVVWVASTNRGEELWSVDDRGAAAPHRITADLGDARFYQSTYDLVIAEGRVHWVAAGKNGGTELRSVALTGGPVDVRDQPGDWGMSAWPWIVDGVTSGGGASTLHNLTTGQSISVPTASRGVTACSPTWCQLVSLNKDGDGRIEVMHPDGSARRTAGSGTEATVITDVVVLDRFEVISQQIATSAATGDVELLIYDVTTHSTIQVSPDAFQVSYRAGVLWWSSGTQQAFLRHALDLRTV